MKGNYEMGRGMNGNSMGIVFLPYKQNLLMTCQHCCGAESLFDRKEAAKEMKRYLKKGPGKTTRKLVTAIRGRDIAGLSLLDIGGGTGAIQFELLKAGIRDATGIDASSAYLETVKKEAAGRGLQNRMEGIHGDFMDHHQTVPSHHIVTLDKVICCYPDAKALLEYSVSKCNRYYGISYPRDWMAAKAVTGLANLFFHIKGNPFRTHIHPVKMIRATIEAHGLKRIYKGSSFPWIIEWYGR